MFLIYVLIALLFPSAFCLGNKPSALEISSFIPSFCNDCTLYTTDFSGATFYYDDLQLPLILCQYSGLRRTYYLRNLAIIRKVRHTSVETLVLSIVWEATREILSRSVKAWING